MDFDAVLASNMLRERDLRELCGESPLDHLLDDEAARAHDPNAERTLAAWIEVEA